MGIKEQTVSVHIRGSYRYRRAPYNRNRRSKRALRFPSLPDFLSFLSFAPSLRCELRVPPARSHYVRVHQLRDITRNHAASCWGGGGEVKEIGEQLEEELDLSSSRRIFRSVKNRSASN